MSWNPITAADVQKKLTAAEYASITSVSLPGGESASTIVAEEITNAIQEVRGYVAGYHANVLGDGATVPDELRDVTLVLIRQRLFTRLPGMKRLLDELRQSEYEEAMRKLRDVAAGRFRLVAPETAASDQAAGAGVQLISSRTRTASPSQTAGLL